MIIDGYEIEPGAALRGAILHFADLTGVDLSGANLRYANLLETNLYKANLFKANLSGANLSGANLTRANLHEANLSKTDLIGTDLTGANLSFTDLTRANLHEANLSKTDLTGANLTEADLSGANLFKANLRYANLTEADLIGANLSWTNLSRTTGLIDPYQWLVENFEQRDGGFVVYKRIGKTEFPRPSHWLIEPGAMLREVPNPMRTLDCACGVNFGTRAWCDANYTKADLWECWLPPEGMVSLVVPYTPHGKAWCGALKLVKILTETETEKESMFERLENLNELIERVNRGWKE